MTHVLRSIAATSAGICKGCVIVFAMIGAVCAQVQPDRGELFIGAEFRVAFEDPPDNPELPNVLLIGDSISIGYTIEVRKALVGKADVFRIPTNGRDAGFALAHLEQWLNRRGIHWDLIHFNWGLWDICYRTPEICATPEQYADHLEQAVKILKATGARLIWCTTTPVPENAVGRYQGDEVKYNGIAEKIMRANGIEVNDLHAYCIKISSGRDDVSRAPGDVHFTAQGYALLGQKVAEEIRKRLD